MSQIDACLDEAQRRLRFGQTDGAIDALRRVLGEAPESAEAHALLAFCLLTKRRLHAALRESELALAADAELPLAQHAAARVALARRHFDRAEVHLQTLLALRPQEADYHREMAELCTLTRRRHEASSWLERALELDPEDADTLAALGDHHLDRGDLARGEGFLRQALEIDPDNEAAVLGMGRLCLRRGETALAREHASQVLRERPDSVPGLYLMAAIKARQSQLLGLWWRYNSWMAELGSGRSIVVLLLAYAVYRVAGIALADAGHDAAQTLLSLAWLGIVGYSLAGPALFSRALKREVQEVRLSNHF